MSEVKRYNMIVNRFGNVDGYESEHGRWVKRDDFAALKAERDQARSTAEYWKAEHLAGNQALDAALAECERLRSDAERYRWLVERGDACQWMNIIRIDPGDYDDLDGAIDAAMSAKP